MFNNQTIEKLLDMRLKSMANALSEQLSDTAVSQLSFEDRFGLIVDRQWTDRKNNHILRLMRRAAFKFSNASIEDIEYHPDRKLNKEMILQLAAGKYIQDKNNITIIGATGAGKTYLGCALGTTACRQLISVKYIRLPELLCELAIARGNGTYKKVIDSYRKYQLLIFDEWFLTPLGKMEAFDLFEIIEARYQSASTIFIAQSAPAGWYQMIGDSKVADAILDRIVHNSHEIFIDGVDSMRKRKGLTK